MSEQELAVTNNLDAVIMEKVVVNGDLSLLKPEQRVAYYNKVCQSVGLNPLTKPFCYIQLNGKLQLYALKDASEQLRKINGISIDKPTFEYVDDLIIVSVNAIDRTGRKDSDAGVVTIGTLKGDNKANAIMKAITKAKRRVTLSISGLGWLDETEIETIPNAVLVDVDDTGEVKKNQPTITVTNPNPEQSPSPINGNGNKPLVDAIIAEGGVPTASMSLETAENMVDSKKRRYGNMTNDELSGYLIGIGKLLAKNGLTHEQIDEYHMKQDAIKVILQSRAVAQN